MALRKQTLIDFQSLLTAIPALTALVGNRIYASQPPQGAALPTLTHTVISSPTEYTHDNNGRDEALIQFDIDGRSATQCREVADALLGGISGETKLVGQTEFESIFHDGVEMTGVEESNVEGTTQSHRLTVDYRFAARPLTAAAIPPPPAVSVLVVGSDGAEYEQTTYPDGQVRFKPVYEQLP